MSLLKKYKTCLVEDNYLKYISFLKRYTYSKLYYIRLQAKERILNYFLRYSPKDTKNFSCAKLMLYYAF
jgi:hypothetical protein